MRMLSRFWIVLATAVGIGVAAFVIGALVAPSWSISSSADSRATPQQIWAWYADPTDWPNWDHLVDRVEAREPFADGSSAKTMANGLTLTSTLRDVVPNTRYTEVLRMPLATMTATHELRRTGSGTRIEHALIITGPGAWIYELTQRRALQSGMNAAIGRLAIHAADGLPRTYLP